MAERSNADILRAAKARIEDRRHYIIGTNAWNQIGRECEPLDSEAVRWGLRGAIYAESGIRPKPWKEVDRDHDLYGLLERAARQSPHTMYGYNAAAGSVAHDCRCLFQVDLNLGHAEALVVFDAAISLAEAAEGGQP